MSTDHESATALAQVVAYIAPAVLGAVFIARLIDTDQPRHKELTRVVGWLLLATALYIPEVQTFIAEQSESRWGLVDLNIFLVRMVILFAAGDYVALAGRLSGRTLLVDFGRPYAALANVAMLAAYCLTPVHTDGEASAGVINLVYGVAAVIASGAVWVVTMWARRQPSSPAVRRSLGALMWASVLGLVYGLLAIEFGNQAIVRLVAGASLGALAVAGALAFVRRQRARQLED